MDTNNKIEIIPALLPDDFFQLEHEIQFVENIVKYVQIDVVDGKFAPTKTWPYNQSDNEMWEKLISQEEGLPGWEKVNFELDLMVKDQLGAAADWISVGASRIIGHIEAFDENFTEGMKLSEYTAMASEPGYEFKMDEDRIEAFLRLRDEFGVEIVLSLNPVTQNSVLDKYLDRIDGVQFMGNDNIGYHGVELDEKVLDKISNLRSKMPELPIGIDIGVKFKTLESLARAGVTRFSSGSVILNSEDPRDTVKKMWEVIDGVN